MGQSKPLRVKRSFSIVGHSPDVVELRTGVWNTRSFTVTDQSGAGKLFDLVRGLDGTLSRGDLAKREGVSRAELEALLDHLDMLGAVETGPSSALEAYLEHVWTLRGAEEVATPPHVVILGEGALAEAVAVQLTESGLDRVVVDDRDSRAAKALVGLDAVTLEDGLAFEERLEEFAAWRDGVVVLAEDTVHPLRFVALNRVTRALGVPWLHAVVDGPFALVGPFTVPGRSACYECFEARVSMNLRESASYQRYKEALGKAAVHLGTQAVLPPVRGLVASHTALEILNYAHTGSSFLIGKVLGIYLPTMEVAYNEVLRLPGCPACGAMPDGAGELYYDVRSWLDA